MVSGIQTRFWKDVWLEECSLKIKFPNLFKICHEQDITVEEANRQQWDLNYRRNFGDNEMDEWREMMETLVLVELTEGTDKVIWKLTNSGKFTTRSMYRYITFGGVIDTRMMEIWKAKIPLKVQIFLWMAWHDRVDCSTVKEEELGWVQALQILWKGRIS